ncbi:TPA: 4-hydroxythreonine-4-phosphate dehydrogenase PdxA [Candidatus Latescibacteria bacterium]|nr:4-hydroxythreonine-4-phosphate dehydrogenase PdxA [Candidatus Latescibacterota bacterium]
MSDKPTIGLTLGDPAGIGPEIVVKALSDRASYEACRPVVYGDRCILERSLSDLNALLELNAIGQPSEGRFQIGTIDYIDPGLLSKPTPYGEISADGGRAGLGYLDQAINAALSEAVDGLATAPLNKESLQAAEAPFIDHTAALKAKAAVRKPMTLFLVRSLRIFFLTRHISFREIADAITEGRILEAAPLCQLYLRQLGIENPYLAIAALNPHGGEQGLFGTDEMDVITPAVQKAKESGLNVTGPVPADSVFHQTSEGKYDGVLSLYHDQGHIAAKTLDFHGTVSLTMGLKFLRTSVDHGTAFDIAGQGIADPRGMVEAIKAAGAYSLSVKSTLDFSPPTPQNSKLTTPHSSLAVPPNSVLE